MLNIDDRMRGAERGSIDHFSGNIMYGQGAKNSVVGRLDGDLIHCGIWVNFYGCLHKFFGSYRICFPQSAWCVSGNKGMLNPIIKATVVRLTAGRKCHIAQSYRSKYSTSEYVAIRSGSRTGNNCVSGCVPPGETILSNDRSICWRNFKKTVRFAQYGDGNG